MRGCNRIFTAAICGVPPVAYAPDMNDSQPPLTPEALATWTDQELITEWMKTTWESGDPRIDAMSDEIERRGLDF